MKNCVFCQIVSEPKEESFRILFEDKTFIVMLVSHPQTRGHFIVFPKNHVSEMVEMENKSEFFGLVIDLAEKFTKKLEAKAYVLKLNNNIYKLENDPLHVGHIHMHVVPRYTNEDKKQEIVVAKREDLEKIKLLLTK